MQMARHPARPAGAGKAGESMSIEEAVELARSIPLPAGHDRAAAEIVLRR